jgi:hypothetical protein
MQFFSSDACPTGCGGIFESNFFHSEFPEFVINMDLHINILEMMSVIVCVKLWGQYFKGKKLMIKCDNQVTVTVINTGKSRNQFLQNCLRELLFVAARHEFEFRAVHILGEENRAADLLSRWHLSEFYARTFYKEFQSKYRLLELWSP